MGRHRFVKLAVIAGAFTVAFAPAASAEVQSFTFKPEVYPILPAQQTFTVPAGVASINVIATGGSGGGAYCMYYLWANGYAGQGSVGWAVSGGLAAVVSTELSVTPGQTLYVEVGGAGSSTLPLYSSIPSGGPGWNGGGAGEDGGAGGGGASDVRAISDTAAGSLQSRLVVAGGGGGAAPEQENFAGCDGSGGNAGLPNGSAGGDSSSAGGNGGGGAATLSTGGAAGTNQYNGTQDVGAPGTLGLGGSGGPGCPATNIPNNFPEDGGGGGGGGLYGGGGGAGAIRVPYEFAPQPPGTVCNNAGGGGGGSSYGPPGTTFATATSGEGPGSVVISWNAPVVGRAPTVTSVSPKGGLAVGGTSVTITGTSFTGVTAVQFGSTNAASFTFNSPTSITAVSPPGPPQTTEEVIVTTPSGVSGITLMDRYRYQH